MEGGHPAGPEHGFHLPGPSWWPATLALGIAFLLTGLVVNVVLLVLGVVVSAVAFVLWVRDVRREVRELPE